MVRTVALAAAVLTSGAGAARIASNTTRARSTCGLTGVSSQIVNGEDANACEWKWQVGFLPTSALGQVFCGGSIVSEEWVLSAAHCATSANFWVVAGEYNVKEQSGKEQVRKAVEIYRHPYYNSRKHSFDYMLVKLEQPFEFNGCVGSVCLPKAGDIAEGSSCSITGWGTLKQGGSQPDIMQEGKVDIVSNFDCYTKFEYLKSDIDDSMICAQGGNSKGGIVDACQGDSGGPLVCANNDGVYTLYGATSWGYGCAGPTYPGVWARVHHVIDWVDDVMSGNIITPAPVTCPSFAVFSEPDGDGDCKCPFGTFCSTDGENINCPSSGGLGGYKLWFSSTCTECACYDS